ncbi:unnamed protein product [Prorocentrum cordatum]|uniref:Uncharacterized protein n=1 Tax=Prorocentrum cordatum TaxID=2364126 RepID=A0ABN9PQ54_9DINO|nr:unnamed protein product [Polarella glacialis]
MFAALAKSYTITACNGGRLKGLKEFLDGEPQCQCLPAQEHRAAEGRPGHAQHQAAQRGFHGVWAAALPGQGTMDSSGVTVLVPSNAMVSAPPLAEPTLVPGRAAAGHAHAGLAKGYANRAILREVLGYLARLNAIGMQWVIGGDWNLEPSVLAELREFRAAQGPVSATTRPTWCCQYFFVSVAMGLRAEQAPRADPNAQQPITRAEVDDAVSTGPRVPVSLGFHGMLGTLRARQISDPRKLRGPPPPGCARFPLDWGRAQAVIQAATDRTGFGQAWDFVLEGLHIELPGRMGRLGETTGTPISGPIGMRWGHFQPQGTNEKIGDRRDGAWHAWAAAARWAKPAPAGPAV